MTVSSGSKTVRLHSNQIIKSVRLGVSHYTLRQQITKKWTIRLLNVLCIPDLMDMDLLLHRQASCLFQNVHFFEVLGIYRSGHLTVIEATEVLREVG